jgi:signal transduction histidine kinase/CheY-like chemotaxis protein/HPt (histidine-containing phosphotransfer) domain-containing protein
LKIRTKALLTIIAISMTITVLSLGIGSFSIRGSLEEVVQNDIKMLANIASKLAADRLELMRSESRHVAERLISTSTDQVISPRRATSVLAAAAKRYEYLSFALYGPDHNLIASYGEQVPGAAFSRNEFAQRAYGGETVVSSTELLPDETLVMRIYTPVRSGHLLISTLPGLVMSDLVSEFRILGQGNVFILDKEGTVVANGRPETVLERFNLLEMSRDKRLITDEGGLIARMVRGETGVGYYSYNGEKRLCAYTPVNASDDWAVGAAAPISATPVVQTERMEMISGVLIMAVASIVAFFMSRTIARPFEIIHEQNASLLELKQLAEHASAAKSSFLANTSHEMRTPLNAVIGLSELMLDSDDLPAEVTAHLEKIYNSGTILLGIVNDLLDIAKIESGKFELIPAEYDVPSMINDTRSLNVLRIADKPIVFELLIDEKLPCRLDGDELRVKQIFNNLLSNACKYTRRGTITWTIGWEREDEAVWLVSSIKDSGIGIREEDIAKLFSDYNQVDTRSNRKIEGTGLGLAITRKMVEAMDGTITVSSVYGEGSTFTVRIRQKFVTDTPIGPTVTEALRGFRYTDSKRVRDTKLVRIQMPYARILVVDDVQTNLDVAKGIMKPYGMKIDCVTSGAEAVDLVRTAAIKYDAIFMDHMMPEMDGMEATRIIREEIGSEYAQNVPIIALTANAIIGNEKLFLEHGFQAFLTKPVDVMRMDAILRQWVRDKDQERALAAQGTLPASSTVQVKEKFTDELPQIDGVDFKAGLERFGGDQDIYRSVLQSYVANTGQLVEQARAVTADTLASYAILVHGIKGASYGIEARDVGKQAEALELAAKGGDFDFVCQHNSPFISAIEKLLADFTAFALPGGGDKERRAAPDAAVLARLEEAAANFRIDEMEEAMRELERYSYETQADLVDWLSDQVNRMGFAEIRGRLETRKEEQPHS